MKPKLVIKNGDFFVTDGEIGGSKFIVKKQPTKEVVTYLQELYLNGTGLSLVKK
ncbi:MAG: hypothetical protein E6248_14595 [Clostridium sp.]|uniref:hypothetical protein n=1 Tax=Clostridium sp. TaxID=1506 RepID=UPI00290950D6|nr:hypothetical protein [Clostridium sp.]MDU5111669.1 hypothetical protein [Clostridium sp.]